MCLTLSRARQLDVRKLYDNATTNHVEQLYLYLIVCKALTWAMARPSAKGMEVAVLVALLTQPPAQHMHIHA